MGIQRLRRGAFLLPSLFTTGNLFLGFLAIVQGLQAHFEVAALLVFGAGVLDGIDGRLARQTGTESDFGKEYDSLADLVTFGMAPALLAYLWGLSELGRIGWLLPFFYLVCAATRLARYNVQSDDEPRRYFVGLPTPASGAALVSVLFIAPNNDWKDWLNILVMGVVLVLALLMVSTFRYRTVKEFDPRRAHSYRIVLLTAAVLLLVAFHPPAFFVSVAALYTCSGPWTWLRGRLARSLTKPRSQPH
jgi:CDP-diacylglycerol--serine O-phosphatidyltransferase